MMIEKYGNHERFNEQYPGIYQFLLEAEKQEYNAHFHWGRFEWMHAHSYLDTDKLTRILLYRDEKGAVAGLTTYDTEYEDRVYLIHTSSDAQFLADMVAVVTKEEGDNTVLKVNEKDTVLCRILREKGYMKKNRCACVLSLDLSNPLEYDLPPAYRMSTQGFVADTWQYQLVIHKGFGNAGSPKNGTIHS